MPEPPVVLAIAQLVAFGGGLIYYAGKQNAVQRQLTKIVEDHEQRLRDGGL